MIYQERKEFFKEPSRLLNRYYENKQYPGHDHRIIPAWKEGYTGKGVTVCVVDDGIEHTHTDLIKNYDAKASHDFNSNDDDAYV